MKTIKALPQEAYHFEDGDRVVLVRSPTSYEMMKYKLKWSRSCVSAIGDVGTIISITKDFGALVSFEYRSSLYLPLEVLNLTQNQ